MGMCIRVHGILIPSIRTGLLLAALLMMTVIPAAAQQPADTQPAGEPTDTQPAGEPTDTQPAGEPTDTQPAGQAAVEPHWSPYTAPTDLSAEDQVYIIVRGDCLWNLAGRFYSDPLLWPHIWDANRYILDAHWIYPGDPLVIPESPDVAAQRMVDGEDEYGEEPMPDDAVADLEEDPVPADQGLEGLALPAETPGAVVNTVDVYCAPIIVPDLDQYKYTILGAEEMEKAALTVDDVVYLDGGEDDGVSAGDRFFVHHKYVKVKHPESGRNLGWAMRQIAELEVLCVNEHDATAVITHACAGIALGDLLIPWEELPIPVVERTAPLERCDEPSGGTEGYLVYFLDSQWAGAAGNIGVIDKGSDDGVGPGDFFAIYRFQEGHRLMLGEAVVLRTERETATVKIVASFREMYVGDRVDRK